MDRPRGHCCARGGSGLGIYRFCHQQSGSAVAGENHGRGCPIAAIPGQGRRQRACSVDCGSRALLCRDCRCDPEFLCTAQIEGAAQQAGEGESDSRAARRAATARSSHAGRGSSGSDLSTVLYAADGSHASPYAYAAGAGNGIIRSARAGPILVAT